MLEKMKIEIILLIIICLICTNTISFPTKPLNERSTELAWQAWLLVDDQNQNNNKNDGSNSLLRRRITPKSVFIAPTFSPELLPACADGYKSDSMGRCIKIIKLDESAHLEFLLAKLNEQFGDYDDDESDEQLVLSSSSAASTPGPLQLNIPLNGDNSGINLTPITYDDQQKKDSASNHDDDGETDVAIVVAPTNGHFFSNHPSPMNNQTKFDVKRDEDLIETTTINPPSTITTTTITTTTSEEMTETLMTETIPPSTTIFIGKNGDDGIGGEAIFFLDPTTTTETNDEGTTTTLDTITTTIGDDITTVSTSGNNKRVTFLNTNNPIRFPDDTKSYIRFPETLNNKHQTRDTLKQFMLSPSTSLSSSTTTEQSIIVNDRYKLINHRNRDKHNKLFLLPTKWSDSSPNSNKPLILRLSRKHGYNMNTEQFNNQPNYYRELQGDNLSFLFGFKQNNHHR